MDSRNSKDCPDWIDDEFEDVAAVVEIGPESQGRATRELVDVRRAPALGKAVDSTEKCLDSATVALGAKTPALDMAGLFAAV